MEDLYVPGWGMADPNRAFIFVDNYDNQRSYAAGGDTMIYKTSKEYNWATAYTLAFDYGFTRIMSSYEFDDTDEGKAAGPPHLDDEYYT